ncbi:CDP-glucose 4,6-dehydratase [Desulfoluna spongiiphila]|uniref:CDP-glucose 4,6-dehydratase n=1 Tax=Desulfoluna spongiiphila TaxID=419481 RepID=UPI00125497A0|nr:CDP-glucose 4,6-dehydratase [Desulfoluna spongiiphila]VVS90865.1 cdp-glucose 4 6-dehydratase [Desulfoluna spongiiphila]
MDKLFCGIYKNRRVLVTGHTGFKGSWLTCWLLSLGANVMGYSLAPETNPNHFMLLAPDIKSVISDIRDVKNLNKAFEDFKPEIVFHLAAQPLVRLSYKLPLETFNTNVMGTANVLEACRRSDSVRAVINITSDKCYENREWLWGYRENDPMGGHDPYSASKGCAELVTASYRNSFFNLNSFNKKHKILVASARAGNVIGGGDWAKDRIVADIIRSTHKDTALKIRNPNATRPWQHVLDPLSGYLLLGQKLLQEKEEFADAWNFGPNDDGNITVLEIVSLIEKAWKKINYKIETNTNNPHEAISLKLDCSKARTKLGWRNVWETELTIEKTTQWYQCFYEQKKLITNIQIKEYIKKAINNRLAWAVTS